MPPGSPRTDTLFPVTTLFRADDPVRDRKAGHACDAVGMETGAGDEVLPANDLPGGLDRNRVRFFDDRPSLGAKEDNASISGDLLRKRAANLLVVDDSRLGDQKRAPARYSWLDLVPFRTANGSDASPNPNAALPQIRQPPQLERIGCHD